MREALVHQREDGFQVPRPRQTGLRAPVPRADSCRQVEKAHGLDRIGSVQGRACLGVGRLEDSVDLVQQRFDDFDGFAVFLRCRGVVAGQVGLVAFGIHGLRSREPQPAPTLNGAAFQRIHLCEQFAQHFFGGCPVLHPLIAATEVVDVLAEIDGRLLVPTPHRLRRFVLRISVRCRHGSRLVDCFRQQEHDAEQEEQQYGKADPECPGTYAAGRLAAGRGRGRSPRRALHGTDGVPRLDDLVANTARRGNEAPRGRCRSIAQLR